MCGSGGITKDCHLFEHAKKWKESGKIKYLGFSFHSSAKHLYRILTEHPETEFVQIALNYYDWESEFVQARKCYEVIRKHGKQLVIMEPVKGGCPANAPLCGRFGKISQSFKTQNRLPKRTRKCCSRSCQYTKRTDR